MKRIAPDELFGRESELAELAAFCTANSGSGYVWWQAPAWSGKSALMSWFVLHPPVEVRVVSFFITARYAGNNDRNAFVEVVLEQLAEIAAQPLPQSLAQGARELWMLRMLKEATLACAATGQRLVLVVDGLDEDRGVTVGPEGHSIAALLPSQLPEGVRVIVSGRPNPPIPADVLDDHPLRRPDAIRQLIPSEHAQVIKADALRELKQLLYGSSAEQDLLGLVAAAGGGLSSQDLAELTAMPNSVIDDHLRAVSGRTFSSRASRWAPDMNPVVYLFAHEDLQINAMNYLGPTRLDHYRNQLHVWNDQYRQHGWPAETPEYLLRGYFRMITSIGDLSRMVACATDQARLDRMLDVSKGDAAAFNEIVTVQNIICDQSQPDLTAMLALAITRDRLSVRSNNMPQQVPAIWASLGNFPRAEAILYSMTRNSHKNEALMLLAATMAAAGDFDRAEELVRTITEPAEQVKALAELMKTAAINEDYDRVAQLAEQAETVAFSAPPVYSRTPVTGLLVEAIAAAGDFDRAEELVRTITEPDEQVKILAELAETAVANEDYDRAAQLAEQTERDMDTLAEPKAKAEVLTLLIPIASAVGNEDKTIYLAEQAETIALTITDPNDRAWALIDLIETANTVEDYDLVFRLAEKANNAIDAIADGFMHMQALAGLIEGVAAAGFYELAEELTYYASDESDLSWAMASLTMGEARVGNYDVAEEIVNDVTFLTQRAETLASLVISLSSRGCHDRAETLANQITNPAEKSKALAALAKNLAEEGDKDRAGRLAEEVEELARSIIDPETQVFELAHLTQAVASTGEQAIAIRLAEKIESILHNTEPEMRELWLLRWWVIALVAIGNYDKAEEVALDTNIRSTKWRNLMPLMKAVAAEGDYDRTEKLVRIVTAADKESLPKALVLLVEAVAAAGDYDRAEELVHTITEPVEQAKALAGLVETAAANEDYDRVTRLSEQAETIMGTPAEPAAEAEILTFLMQVVAATGNEDKTIRLAEQAETIALAITDPDRQAERLADLVKATAKIGRLSKAEEIADAILHSNANTIVLSKMQVEVLLFIARYSGEMKNRKFAALALRQGDWALSLGLLAVIEPSSLLTITDQFIQ